MCRGLDPAEKGGGGSRLEHVHDGFIVTTNSAVRFLTGGRIGMSLDELKAGNHLYDPDNPWLAVSDTMGNAVGATLPVGTAAYSVGARGFLFGTKYYRINVFTRNGSRGILNRSKSNRLGWGFNKSTGRNTFGRHGSIPREPGGKSHWHEDWWSISPWWIKWIW